MNKMLLATIISSLFAPADDGTGSGATGGGGGAPGDTKSDAGKPSELGLRDTLDAELELQEKSDKPENELSEAARRLRAARKGSAPIDKLDDKTIAESERVAKENAEKAKAADAKRKRDAELAAMSEDQRKAALADDEKKAAEAKAAAEKAAADAAGLVAPAHWPADVRTMFEKQPPEVRKFLLERHKAMEADYTKKMQELSPMRRLNDTLDEVFKPYDEEMRQLGVTREQAIRELVGIHARLKKDPVAGLKYIAEISGVDIKTLATTPASDLGEESPIVKALRSEVSGLKDQVSKLTGTQSAAADEARLREVSQFADEKDDKGQPKRPYFDEVAKDITRLLNGAKAAGEKMTLQEAYDSAVFANPTVRAKLLAAQDAERKAKEEKERAEKAEAARRAASGDVTGAGSAAAVHKATDGSVREELEAAFAAHGDRV